MKIPKYAIDAFRAYEATRRVVFIYPRKGMVSLNGHKAIKWQDAYEEVLEVINEKHK